MASPDPPSSPDTRKQSGSARDSRDGLDKVELSDLDASPPPLPIEQDLMQLARLGELRSIQKLFDSGRYNAKSTDDQGITSLHWAAINGHHALCHFLIQSGADVNARGGDAQATPVLWASKRCHLQIVSLLLANGADPLLRDDQGYNLLHSATLDGNVFQLTMLLHQPDIPVDVTDPAGHTSLMWAAYKGFPACVDLLLRWGADVHAVDDSGFTALHWALVRGNTMCIQKLVEFGSDRFVRSKPPQGQAEQTRGDSPADTAAKMKSERQWHKALLDSGFDEAGNPMAFPIPFVTDKTTFLKRFYFLWPFALGGLQLWMLANIMIFLSIPLVLLVGYGLQTLVLKLLRWAPNSLNQVHKTPIFAGIFAGTLFWVGVRWLFHMLPWTWRSHFFLNIAFAVCYVFCTYFYYMTMTADPGFVPRGASRGQTKNTIQELIEHNAFNEVHFCTTCMIRKPLRSKHCKRCDRCVARQDHHCPWVDNCVAVNNHKHFILYIGFMITGIIIMIRLTFAYLLELSEPTELHCTLFSDAFCAEFSKDPLTIVTNAWGSLQLTWTFMLIFAHLAQVARNITTYENMRGEAQVVPLVSAVLTGSTSAEDGQLDGSGAGPTPAGKPHKHKKKGNCFSQWSALLGVDAFLAIAFQGYKGSQQAKVEKHHHRRKNPFTRGIVRNCQDFWADGPLFGRKESCRTKLGGEYVNYANMYEVPKTGRSYRRGYETVAQDEGQEV